MPRTLSPERLRVRNEPSPVRVALGGSRRGESSLVMEGGVMMGRDVYSRREVNDATYRDMKLREEWKSRGGANGRELPKVFLELYEDGRKRANRRRSPSLTQTTRRKAVKDQPNIQDAPRGFSVARTFSPPRSAHPENFAYLKQASPALLSPKVPQQSFAGRMSPSAPCLPHGSVSPPRRPPASQETEGIHALLAKYKDAILSTHKKGYS
eukprot:TRINITY_DN38487_c0_g1_i1.p1 TRINITY_DN38487_c0_g1~~TRINITY_DN38487_c0_g1_i1.p1  ORF type:complete len:210 (+),score=13.38 TRINITY_DN38487_c0_g1_i1:43-672(+)